MPLKPLGGGKDLHGQVLFRGSFVEGSSGLVPVDISVPPGAALLGEMFRADIVVGKVRGYVVPHHAVLVDDIGAPYVVQSNKLVAKKVKVRVLGSLKGNDVVSGPLNPRMPVVVAGAYQMDNGAHNRVEPSRIATVPKVK
jgi:multidrug efflux pump subunit AcrA (membrane-fusion protein)